MVNNENKQTIDLGKVIEATHIRIAVKSVHSNEYVAVKNIAINGYDVIPEAEVLNNAKVDLNNAINEAEALAKFYEAEDFAPVVEKINAAKEVAEDATLEVIVAAKTAIEAAIAALNEIYLSNSEADLYGNSLTLNGTIDVNFYMTLSEEVRNNEAAYMNFTILRGEDVEILKVPVAEAVSAGNDYPSNVYVFKCGVPVKDMETDIKAQIVILDAEKNVVKKGFLYTYSVADYITDISENPGDYVAPEKVESLTALVNTMSDFGNCASVYFNETEGTTMTEEEKVALHGALEAYVATVPAKGVYYGSSLLLKSDTIVRHYFTAEVTEAPEGYKIDEKSGLYYIESAGVPAHELGISETITVTTTAGVMDITYSPLSYAYAVLCREGDADNLTNLMRAMYAYQQAAVAYNQ